MPLPKIEPLFAVAWLGVYFCRVVLIVNSIIYSQGGTAYIDSTYQALDKFGTYASPGNASQHIFPQLVPVLRDDFIQDQNAGLIVLAPFMGAAYTCAGFTSLAAAALFANFEAGVVLLLQTGLFSMIGTIVRPSIPADFYNAGEQDGVQSSQMVSVIMGYIAVLTLAAGVALRRDVPTPVQYAMRLLGLTKAASKEDDEKMLDQIEAKQTPSTPDALTRDVSNPHL